MNLESANGLGQCRRHGKSELGLGNHLPPGPLNAEATRSGGGVMLCIPAGNNSSMTWRNCFSVRLAACHDFLWPVIIVTLRGDGKFDRIEKVQDIPAPISQWESSLFFAAVQLDAARFYSSSCGSHGQ